MWLSRQISPKRYRERFLLSHILKAVSRSFYLSLFILPRSIRTPISVAYLFCRVADTIADTPLFLASQRQRILDIFRRQFLSESPTFSDITQIEAAVVQSAGVKRGEYTLCTHLSDCFLLFEDLAPPDRQLIRELVLTLTQGMQMDLSHFSSEPGATLQALPDFAALERYTYYVAGVVGGFWTKLHTRHIYTLPEEEYQTLYPLGIGFGQGLQMTNILKDLGKDLAIGRCYLPAVQLGLLNITLDELRQPGALPHLRPLLFQLIYYALHRLDQGCSYVLLLPPWALRSRLSCMWPLLFALQTLVVIWRTEQLLCPETRVKISRGAVYRTMFLSLGCLIVPNLFKTYYSYLRRRLTNLLVLYQNVCTAPAIPWDSKKREDVH